MNTTPDLLALLQARGFVHQCTDLEGLRQHLAQGPVSLYLGFDATADSLHVGHLQGLMLMRWMQRFGHHPILLIGGATTRIGDPSFRDESRPMLSEAQIQANIAGITSAFGRYVDLDAPGARVVDNAEWLDGIGYLAFLNQVGRHFSVNRLLTFDAVRQRLDREHSLSFQEFGYTLLQAHDFTELARRHGCTLQLGGADQWANIINGVELGRRQGTAPLYGLTMPLLTTSDGRKMGKSANGAVWLNADRLAPYAFWQFWRNCDDRDVARFLALFTELELDEIARLAALKGAELNAAKVVLANHATALAHGEAAAREAEATAAALFGGGQGDLAAVQLELSAEALARGATLIDLLLDAGLQPSRGAARRLAAGGGVRLDGVEVRDLDAPLPADAQGWTLSLGKKRHYAIRVTRG
ncbi:tyrosine--tRNA ligase [Pseudomonas otitidis]|uniref:tyrosine--tRNA ligase n=1 Tax=Pseudomonadaceae TaxID=135621 RepID=UPI00227B4DE4|nr:MULTISPECIES: tyrosine--tRNA ligase [Pseudomonas]MDH1108422.1 tyrosine--tRNA ligase [Pseudomonas otitidis]MDH1167217.1 tyrosine--tRNA ligase [Pseudomonas otitidis]MDI6526471.1 tyrosine--tRNA ligase [Pseudomonas otitidis]MDU9399090.1 tyrosine--tRNA ligase [Pseudomonas sp. zfem003]WAF87479.1 tyrosine--tRNA ligase [Pseudomonas otitidis]